MRMMKKLSRFLKKKHCLHKVNQDDTSPISKKAAYSSICKIVQNCLRDMQHSWLSKVEEIKSFADRKYMKKFHDALETVYGQLVQEPPHCLVQMEAHFSLIKILSWKGGQNTSIACSITHNLSTKMLSTDCHKQRAMFCLMNFQPWWKQRK